MRISDWSSDVCSSDLRHGEGGAIFVARDVDDVGDDRRRRRPRARARALEEEAADEIALGDDGVERAGDIGERMEIGRESCRERVCQYGVDLGGRGNFKTKN